MDLEKAYPSGRFGSNGFDLKHTEPHYIQEAPKLAETPRTEILETGPVINQNHYSFLLFVHCTIDLYTVCQI